MKKYFSLLIILTASILSLNAQVVAYHEDFELPSLDDSVTYTSSPTAGYVWNINTRLHHGATSFRSDSCQVKAGTTIYMTSNSFNTVGNTFVNLSFSQICKVDFLDIATIEVSNNGGTTWTQLTSLQYTGTGQYGANGNRFASNSYGNLWIPGTPAATPQNTWWRSETFDVSTLLGNTADAKIRFKLADGGTVGPNNNKGWYIDNILVTMAPSELIPPVITLVNPYPQGILYSLGPFTIKAKITDASGVDTAYIVYSVNAGLDDTVGMIHTTLDTMKGIIPAMNDSDVVCWRVEAFDNSLAHNWARNPVNNCISFTAYGGITFPFYDNFDLTTTNFTPSYGGTNQQTSWQLGTPTFPSPPPLIPLIPHSPPNVWSVSLNAAYNNSAYCILTSPVFDFSNAENARLAFWTNYNTETSYDGTRLEYTTNGVNWELLGIIGDPPPTENWYTNTIYSSNQPAWAGNSQGWKKSKYKLSLLNNVTGTVRFRYIFTSDGSVIAEGFSIDDFSITLPSPQEIMIESIVSPTVGACGMGNEYITIKMINTGMNPITSGLQAGFKKAAWAPAVIENIADTLNPEDTLTYTFTTPIDLSANMMDSTFNIKVWVHLNADPNTGDDTLVKQIISKFVPPAPAVTNVNINYGTSTTITATSASTITWYSALTGGTLLGSGPNLTTPILYGTTVYYPEATALNGCTGPRASDTVFVGQAPPFDGSTLAIIAPVSGINLPNNAVVTSQIRNYGTQPISNFPVSYKINNLAVVSETCPTTIQPGDILNYNFTTTADLSAFATYNIKAWLDIPGDQNQVNDTSTSVVVNSMYTYCISRADYTGLGNIGNVTVSNINNGNANPIFNNANANQVYTSYTNLNPIYLSRGQGYNFSLTGIYSGSHSTCHARVFVDWNYDGTFDEITETALTLGPTLASNTTLIGTLNVPVTAHLGLTMFRVVFQYTTSPTSIHPCGTYSYGETEDYLAMILPQLSIDAGVVAITVPPATYPQGYNGTPTVTVKNYGYNAISTMDVFYQIDNDPVQTLTWNGTLPANTPTNIVFPPTTFPNGGHEICAWVILVSDSNAYNDTICKVILGVPVDTLPYYDNFDGVVKFTATTTSGTSWIHGAPSGTNFPGPPVSSPNVWCTNLNSNSYTASANCILTTQIFDFTNAINAKMSFWINYDTETAYDGTRVEYSLDGGTLWSILGSINDPLATNWYTNTIISSNQPAWAGTSNGWKKVTYLLSDFNQIGTVRFRFVFTADPSVQYEGSAIDDFKITIPYHKDAGVDLVYAPTGIADAGSQLQVKVRLNNFGMDPMTSTPISYIPGSGSAVTETWNGNLAPGDSVMYTFTTTYTVPEGTYTLKSYTSLPDDGDHLNDTVRTELFGLPVYIVPYVDNFDSATGYWYTTGSLWEHGSPTSSIIDHPYSNPYCWKTNLDGVYPHSGFQYLYSPKFDFSVAGMDTLKFFHWLHTNVNDWGRVEYLANDGTWKTLGGINDPNGYNWFNIPSGWSNDTNTYMLSKYDLKIIIDYAIPTQFRWLFNPYTYNNVSWDGWAVDNVELTFPRIQIDAGVTAILQPTGTTTYGTDITVQAIIKNFGWDTLTNVPVKYMINGITVAGGFYAGPLYPDSSAIYTFSPIPSPMTSYTLCAYTDLNFDTYYFNDSSCHYITVVPPPYDIEVTEITQPMLQTIYGESATVTVNIKNRGINPVSQIPITYTLQDTFVVVNEVWQGTSPLEPSQSITYSFTQQYLFPAFGFYNLCVYTNYIDDGYRLNDTLCQRLESHYTDIPEIGSNGLYLFQNTPNPADEMAQIVCNLPHAGDLEFRLINHLGQIINSRNERADQGEYLIELNTKLMAPGIYYYYIQFGDRRMARKMIVNH
ncbi:MAG: GEVED domain-containing protein [Bacteroidales bacterium]